MSAVLLTAALLAFQPDPSPELEGQLTWRSFGNGQSGANWFIGKQELDVIDAALLTDAYALRGKPVFAKGEWRKVNSAMRGERRVFRVQSFTQWP